MVRLLSASIGSYHGRFLFWSPCMSISMSILSCEIRSEIDGLEQALVIPKPSLESLPHDLPAPVPVPVPVQLRAVERYQINNSHNHF